MNKKTYGEGVRTERVDHQVVAETIAAKEKLRDTLGHGEEIRTEELSRAEYLKRRLQEASRRCDEAAEKTAAALEEHRAAVEAYREIGHEYLAAIEEDEKDA